MVKKKLAKKTVRKAPKPKKLGGKGRPKTPAERKKLGIALARVKGKTTGYDPTVYEPKGRSHSPNMTGAKDVVNGVDKYTGNKVFGVEMPPATGKAKTAPKRVPVPHNRVSGGGVQAADTYLNPDHIRQEPGWDRTLDRFYKRYMGDQGHLEKLYRDIELLRANALKDHGSATENREAQRAFIAYRTAAIDMEVATEDDIPPLEVPAVQKTKKIPTGETRHTVNIPDGADGETPAVDTTGNTTGKAKTTPTSPTTGKTRDLKADNRARRRASNARRKYTKLADEDNQKARDELAAIKDGDDEATTGKHLEAYREHRTNAEINSAIASDANIEAEYARLHLDRIEPEDVTPDATPGATKETKELTEEEKQKREEARAKARVTREANKAAREAELEAQARQGTKFKFLKEEALERANKARARQAKHLELAEKYMERGDTERAQRAMLRYERAVRSEHRNRLKAVTFETEHEYEKRGLSSPLMKRHSDKNTVDVDKDGKHLDTPNIPDGGADRVEPDGDTDTPDTGGDTDTPDTDGAKENTDGNETGDTKDTASNDEPTTTPNEPDTVPNTDHSTPDSATTRSTEKPTNNRGNNPTNIQGETSEPTGTNNNPKVATNPRNPTTAKPATGRGKGKTPKPAIKPTSGEHKPGEPFESRHLKKNETLIQDIFGGGSIARNNADIYQDKDGYTVSYKTGLYGAEHAHRKADTLEEAREIADLRGTAQRDFLDYAWDKRLIDEDEYIKAIKGEVAPGEWGDGESLDALISVYAPDKNYLQPSRITAKKYKELSGTQFYGARYYDTDDKPMSDNDLAGMYNHAVKNELWEEQDEYAAELLRRGYNPDNLKEPRHSTEESKRFAFELFEDYLNGDDISAELKTYGQPGTNKPGKPKRTRRKGKGDKTPSTAGGGGDKGGNKPPSNRGGATAGDAGDAGDGDNVPNAGKGDSTPGGKSSGKASSKPKTTKREDKPTPAGGNSGDDGGKKPPTTTTTTGGEHNDKDNNGENLTPEQKEAKEKAEKLKKLVENYEASVNEASRNPVAKLDGINTYDDVTSGEKQKDLYYSLVTMGRNDPVAMRNQLDKVVERVEPEFWDRRDELAEIKPYVTKKYDPDDPNATDLGDGDEKLRKQRVTVAKEVATEISEKLAEQDRRETPSIVSAIMEAGGTPAGLQFRVKTHASIVSKLHRKAKDKYKFDNPGEDGNNYEPSDLREMAGKVKDGFRFTAVVPKDGYTDKADELVRIMQRNGWTVTKPKRHEFGHYTWDSYPGLNLVFEKNGENVEIQVQTPYSFVAKNATHVAYDIARDGDEENPDIIRINQDQKTIFGCVPTPKNVANDHYIENPLENREEDKKWQPSTTRETSLSSKTTDKNSGVSTTQNLGTGNDTNGLKESTSAPTTTGSRNSPKRKHSKQSPKTSKNTTGSKSGLEKRTPTSSNETTRTKPNHVDTSQATFKEINERLSKRGRVTVDGVDYEPPTTGVPENGDLARTTEGWGIVTGYSQSHRGNPNAGFDVNVFDNKGQKNEWHGELGADTTKRTPVNRGDGGNGGSTPSTPEVWDGNPKASAPVTSGKPADNAPAEEWDEWVRENAGKDRITRTDLIKRGWDVDQIGTYLTDEQRVPGVPGNKNVSNKHYSLAEVEDVEANNKAFKRAKAKKEKAEKRAETHKAKMERLEIEAANDVDNPPSVKNPKPNGDTIPLARATLGKRGDTFTILPRVYPAKTGDYLRVIKKDGSTRIIQVGKEQTPFGYLDFEAKYLPEPAHETTFRDYRGNWHIFVDKGTGVKPGDKITVKDGRGNEHVRIVDRKDTPLNVKFDQFTLSTPATAGNDSDGYRWTKRGGTWLVPVAGGAHKPGDKVTVKSHRGEKDVYLSKVHSTEDGVDLWEVSNRAPQVAEPAPEPTPEPTPELSTPGQHARITALQAENTDVFVDPQNPYNVGHWHENLRVILSPENFQEAKQRARHGYADYLWNQWVNEHTPADATDMQRRKAKREARRQSPMKEMTFTDDMARYLIEHSVMAKRLEFEKALYATPEKLNKREAEQVIDVLDNPSVFTSKNFTEVKPIWLDAIEHAVSENGMSKRELNQRLIIGDYWEGTVKGGAPSQRQLKYARDVLYRHMREYGVGENDNLMLDSFTIANPWRYLDQLSGRDLSDLIDVLKNDSM